jgi:hypothetical protein
MSKMDNLRAMREARYAASAERRPAARPAKPVPVAPEPSAGTPPPPAPEAGLCGHRNMGGRTCTRPEGHPEKSHRYS